MTSYYHVIKEEDIDLEMIQQSIDILNKSCGFDGLTHRDFQEYGQLTFDAQGLDSTFGYSRNKQGVPYWVLPYEYIEGLEVERLDTEGNLLCKSYTEEELNNFGFDEITQ